MCMGGQGFICSPLENLENVSICTLNHKGESFDIHLWRSRKRLTQAKYKWPVESWQSFQVKPCFHTLGISHVEISHQPMPKPVSLAPLHPVQESFRFLSHKVNVYVYITYIWSFSRQTEKLPTVEYRYAFSSLPVYQTHDIGAVDILLYQVSPKNPIQYQSTYIKSDVRLRALIWYSVLHVYGHMGTPTRRWNALSVVSGALGEPSRAP